MKFKFLTPLLAVATAVPTFQDDPKHDPNVTPACISAGYATFYDDHNCKDNPGRPVSLKNSGCLANEIGRNSIYVQRPCELMRYFNGLSLVWSPGNDCNCQNDCAGINYRVQGCWDLGNHQGASSFRFIREGCSRNNC